jgi:hypothetical protein
VLARYWSNKVQGGWRREESWFRNGGGHRRNFEGNQYSAGGSSFGLLELPIRGSIGENRTNEEFIGLDYCHLLLSPESASDGFEDV